MDNVFKVKTYKLHIHKCKRVVIHTAHTEAKAIQITLDMHLILIKNSWLII